MIVTRISAWSGKLHSREIDITPEQLRRWYAGELVQKVMPDLSDDDREFLISGLTPEEWEEYIKCQCEGGLSRELKDMVINRHYRNGPLVQ